ncbi:cell division protein FtsQ/DivIB [Simiduia litorea]|uniref:cell division protein FtsQ/DivIB n=1 Tax=Simiduia litorea TaxID=1435348 RepID=UPI0036F1CABD
MKAESKRAVREKLPEGKPGFVRKILLGSALLAVLVWLAPQITRSALAIWDRPVNGVAIEGQFRLVDKEHIASLLEKNIDTGFWQLDIQGLQVALEQDPWIDYVLIRRRWPDRLIVEVVEQNPIARWADRGFVNYRAELILANNVERLAGLPRLDAEDRSLGKLMQSYQTIAALMSVRNLNVARIELDKRGSWKVQLQDGVKIAFGRHQLQERMRLFAKVYDDQLAHRWTEVNSVDVRYNNGAAVSWRKST